MFVSSAAPCAQTDGTAVGAAAADEEADEVVMAEGRVSSGHDAAALACREALPSILPQWPTRWHNAKANAKRKEDGDDNEAELEEEPCDRETESEGPFPSPAEIEASVRARGTHHTHRTDHNTHGPSAAWLHSASCL
jgi:hypothetical protein